MNLLIDENFLVIDNGSRKIYMNASWCTLDFTNTSVVITNQGKEGVNGQSVEIDFDEFQYDSSDYNTESAIFDILKDKIG